MAIIPNKLRVGDVVRIVAPSQSLSIISQATIDIATERLRDAGLVVTFAQHVAEIDEYRSSTIGSRVFDIHKAFADQTVKAIFSVIGGHNCNQLFPYLNWDLIRKNPKIFIGYSDTTALQNAIFAKTNLVTYSGPAFSTFGQKLHFDHTMEYFKRCLFSSDNIIVSPASEWSDDAWYIDQNNRRLLQGDGHWILAHGDAEGTIIGGNLNTFSLLQGTPYFPYADDIILFLEEDEEVDINILDRQFESLLQTSMLSHIRGIIFGRFQNNSAITRENMRRIIDVRPQLLKIPILANVDFGHTSPIITFPIGGKAHLNIKEHVSELTIVKH